MKITYTHRNVIKNEYSYDKSFVWLNLVWISLGVYAIPKKVWICCIHVYTIVKNKGAVV